MKVRSSLRKAHWMRIQKELYLSYLKNVDSFVSPQDNKEHNPFDTSRTDSDQFLEENLSKEKKYPFLPANLVNKFSINYKELAYYKAGKHSCTTEEFVMAFPRNISKSQHKYAMSKTESIASRFFYNSTLLSGKLYLQSLS